MGLLCKVKVMQRMISTICDKWISMGNNIIKTCDEEKHTKGDETTNGWWRIFVRKFIRKEASRRARKKNVDKLFVQFILYEKEKSLK